MADSTLVDQLSARILDLEDLLRQLFDVGDALGETGTELEAVRRASQTISAVFRPHSLGFYYVDRDESDGSPVLQQRFGHPRLSGVWPLPDARKTWGPEWRELGEHVRVFAKACSHERAAWAMVAVPSKRQTFDSTNAFSFKLLTDQLQCISRTRETEATAIRETEATATREALARMLDEHQVIMQEQLARMETAKREAFEALQRLDTQVVEGNLERPRGYDTAVKKLAEALYGIDEVSVQLEETVRGVRPIFADPRRQYERPYLVPLREVVKWEVRPEQAFPRWRSTRVHTKPSTLRDGINYFRHLLGAWANASGGDGTETPPAEIGTEFCKRERKVLIELSSPIDLNWQALSRCIPERRDHTDLSRYVESIRDIMRKLARGQMRAGIPAGPAEDSGLVQTKIDRTRSEVVIELAADIDEGAQQILREIRNPAAYVASQFRGTALLAVSSVLQSIRTADVTAEVLDDGLRFIVPRQPPRANT